MLIGLLAAATAQVAIGAPRTPQRDDEVIEQLAQRRDSPMRRETARLRAALRAAPNDADAAVALAQHLYDAWSADGDPRHIGHAQAALAPWWKQPDPPLQVRVMRAVLKQLNHDFDPAMADLQQAVREDADNAEAWSWIAAIALVQTDYPRARSACEQLARLEFEPAASACAAQVDAATGHAERAAIALQAAAQAHADADPALRLWILTRLAETQQALGRSEQAEKAYRDALALQRPDGYLQAAYADFLLDRGRAAEVVPLLKDALRSDVLLLRLVIATQRVRAANAGTLETALAERFDAARQRGDTVHRKEEARFWLDVRHDAQRALPLAVANYAQQREIADARLLLEAAIGAGQPQAAEPALRWLRESGNQDVVLRRLAVQLESRR